MNLNQENKIGKQACEDNAKDTIPFSRNNDESASKTKHTLTNAGINIHVSSSLDGKDTNLINMEKNNDEVHSNENMTCDIIESEQMNKNIKNQVLDICSDRVEAATDETSNLKTPQKYFGEYFTVQTYEEFQTLLENYFERTGTRFTVYKRSKYFGRSSTECDFSNHKVTWQEKENPLNPIVSFDMPYNGIPRINVGDFYLQCQFGSDFGASKKLKREKQEKLKEQIGEGKDIKRRSLKIPTKKCGCPAKMSVKQVGTFPEYKIPINSEFRRRTAAVKLRKQLSLDQSSVHCEMYILGRFPDMSEHKNHGAFEGHEHDKEMIDKDIVLKIQQLHMHNLTISAIIKSCEDFVLNHMFYKQKPPERKRRKYFPKSKDIRNIVTRMRVLCHCSEEQEKRISDFIEQAKGENEYLNACFDVKYQDSQEVDAESSDDEFFEPDSDGKANKKKKKTKKPESKKQTFLFCCQTQKQQRLLKRYGGIVFVVRVENKSRAVPFHMYNILVQTNVDYQTVCSMIVSRDNKDGVKDGMTLLKEWNTYWRPKYFVVDSVKEIYNAVDDLFPEASYFLNPQSCEYKWMEFLNTPSNELADQAKEVMACLRNMAYSTTEDSLTIAAALFEGSSVWNNSSKLRTWFQTTWLHMAKKWVFGYRPEDLLITNHWKVSPNECVREYEQALVEVTQTKYWLESVIKSVCTKIPEDDYKEYANRNKELYLTSKEFFRDNPISSCYQGVPMAILPHVYDVGVIAQQNKFEISDNQLGLFTVKYEPEFVDVAGDERLETTADQPGKESDTSPKADATIDGQIEELSKDILQSGEFTVSFSDLWNYPFCTCSYWQMYKLPCVHMFAVFCEVPDWKYDMLAPLYRFANVLHFDYSCVDAEIDNKSSSSDAGCQTTILSQSVEIQKDLNEENLFIRPPSVDKNFLQQCNEFLLHFDKLAILFKDKKLYKTLRHELQSLRNDLLSNAVNKKNPFEVLTVKRNLSNEIKCSLDVSPLGVTKVIKSTSSVTQMKVVASKKNVTVVRVAEGDNVNSVLNALVRANPRKSFKVYREDAAEELLSENSAVTKLNSETLTQQISELTPILSKVSTRSAKRNLKRTVIVVKAGEKTSKKESAGCLSNVPRKLQPTVLKKATKLSAKRTTKGIVNEKSECSSATGASSINRSLTEDTTVKNPTIAKDVGPLLGVCTSPVSSSIVSNKKSHTSRTLAVKLDAHSSIPITLEKSKPRPSKNYPRSVVIVKSKSQSGHVSDQQNTEKRNLSPKRKNVSVMDYLPNFKKKCPDI